MTEFEVKPYENFFRLLSRPVATVYHCLNESADFTESRAMIWLKLATKFTSNRQAISGWPRREWKALQVIAPLLEKFHGRLERLPPIPGSLETLLISSPTGRKTTILPHQFG